MSTRDLDAARIADPHLRESYERCRVLNAAHGKTYYLATLLLPPAKRPYVHALYGFARYADEIVDDLASTLTEQEKAESVQEAKDNSAKLKLVSQTLPIAALVLGLILLVIGILLVRRPDDSQV